jgi:hypothetical protein
MLSPFGEGREWGLWAILLKKYFSENVNGIEFVYIFAALKKIKA